MTCYCKICGRDHKGEKILVWNIKPLGAVKRRRFCNGEYVGWYESFSVPIGKILPGFRRRA